MLKELGGEVLVDGIMSRQFERRPSHIQAIRGHPCCSVGLLQSEIVRKDHAAIDDTDIVQPEKATLEQVFTAFILPVHPPREVDNEFVKDARQKVTITLSSPSLFSLVERSGRRNVDGRIHVAEGPLVRR